MTFISGNGDLSVPSQQPRRHSTGYINIAELQPNLENMKIKPDVSIMALPAGCGVFKAGTQNWKGFCIKINCRFFVD